MGVMRKLDLPEGWSSDDPAPRWGKPYGWHSHGDKKVNLYPPKWIPRWFGLRDFFCLTIWNHETLHAWGSPPSPGCGNPFCLGYEVPMWKYLAMPLQLLNGLLFCNKCMSYYKKGG
jgi:hypothetical protein